ncbi:hypothetical protein [Methylosinus sp. Sm6]|nr:hypothetical protein [Methylosinus sp. Sm6]
MTQRVAIIRVFIAEREADQPLSEQRRDLALDQRGICSKATYP